MTYDGLAADKVSTETRRTVVDRLRQPAGRLDLTQIHVRGQPRAPASYALQLENLNWINERVIPHSSSRAPELEDAMPFPDFSDVAVRRRHRRHRSRAGGFLPIAHDRAADLFETRLPLALRDRAPRFSDRDNAGPNVRVGGWTSVSVSGQAYDSISAEVLYRTHGAAAWVTGRPELRGACAAPTTPG